MQIITLLNKSKNSFYLSQHIRDGLMAFAFGRNLLQLYWRISCTMTFWLSAVWCRLKDSCDAKLYWQPAKGQRNFHSLSALYFCRRWNMFWCLVLSVADLKEKFGQKLHLPKFFSIAEGWPSSPKIFSTLSTSWRKAF